MILHLAIAVGLLLLALLPTLMLFANLKEFHKASTNEGAPETPSIKVSILIPARNEEASIGQALESMVRQSYRNLEVIVLDDHSEDSTAKIVTGISSRYPFMQLRKSKDLPEGWNGKQHACWQLASAASGEFLLFLDADVRLHPDAVSRIVQMQAQLDVDLLSGFPKQETITFAERMLIPMMYVVLLGYLPLKRSRIDHRASMAAGCGQLFYARKDKYFQVGGHEAIKGSRHDGIQLPRTFRAAGATTDLFDASDLATCRMYQSLTEVQRGLLKNASEGIANARLIVVFTVLLLGAFVMPLAMFLHSLYWKWEVLPQVLLCLATIVSFLPRVLIAARLESSYLGAVLQPIAMAWFVCLQWIAFIRSQLGVKSQWRGRTS